MEEAVENRLETAFGVRPGFFFVCRVVLGRLAIGSDRADKCPSRSMVSLN